MLRALATAAMILASGPCAAATVRIGLPSFPPSNAAPFDATSRAALLSMRAIFDALTQLGDGMRPEPALATSWRNTDDLTWIVTLRPNVSFSNGEPMNADAVVFSYNVLKTPEAFRQIMVAEVQNIVSVRAVDPLMVEVKTKLPDPGFARRMAIIPIVAPAHWKKVGLDGYTLAPIGTGSFAVEKWDTARVTLTAFKKSWRAPVADRLEILNLPIATTRVQALLSGRIDIAADLGPETIDTIKSAGFVAAQRPVSSVDVMTLNAMLPNSPFKDVRVRQALNYAIDRDTIAKQILNGLVPPASQVTARINPEYDPSIAPYPYDPAKAKALLKEAGYPDGFSFVYEMNNAGGADMSAIMEQIAHSLGQVGIKMEIRPAPWPQIVQHVRYGGWTAQAFGLEFEDLPAGDTLWPFRLHACVWQAPWYCDETLTPVIAEARTTFDPKKRLELIHKVLRRTHEQAAVVPLFEPVGLDGLSPKVKNYTQTFGNISYPIVTVAP